MTELGSTTDPVALIPGSVSGLYDLSGDWRTRADGATDAADRLAAVTIEAWTGAGADAFASRMRDAFSRWTRLSEAYSAAATAIDDYAATLTWAQGQAADAIDLWQQGAQADTAAAPVGGGGTMFAEAPDPDLSFTPDPGDPDRVEATRVLAEARRQLGTAGDTAASAVNSAATEPDVDAQVWAALGGVTVDPGVALAALDGMSGAEIATLLGLRPELRGLLSQADPTQVATWWRSLDDAGQQALIAQEPAFIGNLEGVDYTSRDEANRLHLDDQLADAQAEVDAAEAAIANGTATPDDAVGGRLAAATEALATLQDIHEAVYEVPLGGAPRFLITLSDDSPPLAAVSLGDLDTADDVTYAVPGMNTYSSDMTGWSDASQALLTQQDIVDPTRTHAVVAWIGYETPPIPVLGGGFEVMGMEMAQEGAEHFADALQGLAAVRADDPPVTNVVAHSYGTPTVATALTMPGIEVDSFVSIGSAGLPSSIDSVDDIHADAVYAGQARNVLPLLEPGAGDQWADTGRLSPAHPIDPTSPEFGAQVFGADGDTPGLAPVTDHDVYVKGAGQGYLEDGTESLLNVAYATTGHPDLMTDPVPKGLTDFEKQLVYGPGAPFVP